MFQYSREETSLRDAFLVAVGGGRYRLSGVGRIEQAH